MKKIILIGIIVLFLLIVGITSLKEYKYWQPHWTAEEIWLTKEDAENALKTFASQYLKQMNLDLDIKEMILQSRESYGTTSGRRGGIPHPEQPGKLITAGLYSGKIVFSKDTQEGTLEVYYDGSVLFGITPENISLRGACIIDDKECILRAGRYLGCTNKTSGEAISGDVSNYFSCICNHTTSSAEAIKNLPMSNWEECSKECYKKYKGTCMKTEEKFFCHMAKVPIPPIRSCSLDFSAKIEPSPDNKTKVIIDTPNYIPELTIKGWNCSHIIENLQPGTFEKITDCDFGICIKLSYKEYQIAEFNCR